MKKTIFVTITLAFKSKSDMSELQCLLAVIEQYR